MSYSSFSCKVLIENERKGEYNNIHQVIITIDY